MAFKCNLAAKIVTAVGLVVAIVAVIMAIMSAVQVDKAASVEFLAESSTDYNLNVASGLDGHLGFSLFVAVDTDCEATTATITKPASATNDVLWLKDCSNPHQEEWMKDNDPALQKLGHFFLPSDDAGKPEAGDYRVQTSNPSWAIDAGDELGEAVASGLAALGLMLVVIILAVVAGILFCIACCCACGCCGGQKEGQAQGA